MLEWYFYFRAEQRDALESQVKTVQKILNCVSFIRHWDEHLLSSTQLNAPFHHKTHNIIRVLSWLHTA